jgi:hypothetical protein
VAATEDAHAKGATNAMADLDFSGSLTKRRFYTVEGLRNKTPFIAKVCNVTLEPMNDGKEKACVWFEGHDQGVVSEGRRITDLAEIAGSPKRSAMIGTKVRVAVEKVKGKSGAVESITFTKPDALDDDTPF